ncbi:twin-arginine translocase subunit TatC [Haloferula sp. A504]|uniref:twin-arginine translocase subunit TatC n=1 Tax=Haloferula sp. A504 TaxID=3373601 RepID=UPI0031C996C9|nr:twin-arginine translocase subunit TatC [Verrucomicrobiaceae bacterium E54]
MYLLKKVFQLRDKSNPDMEKPFLEHLEDLRAMITRVVLTLLIATIGCFVLQERVMDILRKPVEDVWATHVQTTLPETIQVEDWETAKDALNGALGLPEGEREAYLANFDEPVRKLVPAMAHLRAASKLPEERRGGYLDHLAARDPDLRKTIDELIELGTDPVGEQRLSMMSALKPTETFMLSMKLAFFAGIVVSFPFLLFFILQFVLPGLHTHERKILWPSMLIGFGLFLLGVLFAYYVVLPRALAFFFEWDQGLNVASDWRIGWYIGFATQFTLLFGLSFELPVVIMALVKIGLLSYEMMSRTRSYAVLTVVVLAAVITPTGDLITLSLMAVPMYILYEICILLAWLDRRKEKRAEAEEEKERLERLLKEPDMEETEAGEEEDTGDDLSDESLYGDHDHDRAEDDLLDRDPYDPYDPDEIDDHDPYDDDPPDRDSR